MTRQVEGKERMHTVRGILAVKVNVICRLAIIPVIIAVTFCPFGRSASVLAGSVASIQFSFRLDPWLVGGTYSGGLWVSPPVLGPMLQATIETRVDGIDANGQATTVNANWTPSDPNMVVIAPQGVNTVNISILRPGHSLVRAVYLALSRDLSIDATSLQPGILQVTISQTSSANLPPLEFTFPPDGATASSSGLGTVAVSYGMISSNVDHSTIAAITYRAQGVGASTLITEVGVAASKVVRSARLFVDYSANIDIGFAVVNPGSTAISITAELKDEHGNVITSTALPIRPLGHTAMFVSQLIPRLSPPFWGTLTLTSANGFVAVNLRTITNTRDEMLLSSLPVADLDNPSGESRLIFPVVVDGGGMSTRILLMNSSSSSQSTGTVELFDDRGAPLALDFGDPSGPRSSLNFAIEPDGAVKFFTNGKGSVRTGYGIVTVNSGVLPVGCNILQFDQAGVTVSETGVQDSRPTTASRLYVETASKPLKRDTGIAMVNPNAATSDLMLQLTGLDGSSRSARLTMGPNEHRALLVTELFPDLPADYRGILNVTSTQPNSYLTVRFTVNERGEALYSAIPAADLVNPPKGMFILPEIVDGGGFVTQVIALNASTGAGTADVRIFDESGNIRLMQWR